MLTLTPPQLTYDDVLIKPNVLSHIRSRFDDSQCNPYYKDTLLPIVSSPMDTIHVRGLLKQASIESMLSFLIGFKL